MSEVEISDLSTVVGAEVSGFDMKLLNDADTCQMLQEAFDRRGVLVFRDIDFTHAEQMRLSKLMIREDESADPPREDNFYVSNRRDKAAAPFGRLQFHADMMWADHPFQVLSLYGSEVEQPAAPTTFVSGSHAWKTLPDDLRSRVEGLSALHTAGEVRRGDLSDVLVTTVENPPTATKPIGLRHPRTGETILYVCEQMTKEVVGLSHDESELLLEQLFTHLYDPAGCVEHRWRERDLAIWDNLALQHAREYVTIEGPARTLRKFGSPHPRLRPDQIPVFSEAK